MSEPLREPARRVRPANPALVAGPAPARGDYEFRVLTFGRGTSRSEARRQLTEHAEYGGWELARVQLAFGGRRRVWLRRRIIRVARTA
jgi:hypothetical protein